jgi:hypothetical protein
MHPWLETASGKLAAAVGDDPDGYRLTQTEVDDLLDLARIAAHESGERTNAPLLAYLAGLARGRHPDRALGALVDDAVDRRAQA